MLCESLIWNRQSFSKFNFKSNTEVKKLLAVVISSDREMTKHKIIYLLFYLQVNNFNNFKYTWNDNKSLESKWSKSKLLFF